MRLVGVAQIAQRYDFVVVGTGFGSLFFTHRLLDALPPNARVLLIERGRFRDHATQIAEDRNGDGPVGDYVDIENPAKKNWNFTVALGGGTLCWWGQSTRFHPSSFNLKTTHGFGRDWPISYGDLEEDYCDAEEIIGVSGDSDDVQELPRSRPFPFPAHVLSTPDRVLKAAYPGRHIALPSARPSIANDRRSQCCANGVCGRCPVDAKFTGLNGMARVFEDPRVAILIDACVTRLDIENKSAKSVVFEHSGREFLVAADHVVLGANALFNPVILAQSGLTHPLLGRRLNEQRGLLFEVHLAKLDALDGGSAATGLYLGGINPPDRAQRGSFTYTIDNRWRVFGLRPEAEKAKRVFPLIMMVEEDPQIENHVDLSRSTRERPRILHPVFSNYGRAGVATGRSQLESYLSPLGLEWISEPQEWATGGHMEGTTVMGNDRTDSIVDADQIHHEVRNLSIVGSSVFPTCGNYTPSLTVAALSLRAARRLTAKS
ncbi:MAG: GMC oxidoreductase [Labrys sp. (in: a-proteobacteria)]